MSHSQKLTGKSRRTLYRDMALGFVSYRINVKGHCELETSELIRVYGEFTQNSTEEWLCVAQSPDTQNDNHLLAESSALRQEVGDLKSMQLRLENRDVTLLHDTGR